MSVPFGDVAGPVSFDECAPAAGVSTEMPSSAASTAAASSSARSQRGAAARTSLQSELFIERRAEISGSLVCAGE